MTFADIFIDCLIVLLILSVGAGSTYGHWRIHRYFHPKAKR